MRTYELSPEKIKNLVPKSKPGTYYLGEFVDNKFYVLYIGRSDSCLKTRLLQHAQSGTYHFFGFRMCKTKNSAYRRECYLFHYYKKINNKIHPANNSTCNCPICSSIDEFQTALPN